MLGFEPRNVRHLASHYTGYTYPIDRTDDDASNNNNYCYYCCYCYHRRRRRHHHHHHHHHGNFCPLDSKSACKY